MSFMTKLFFVVLCFRSALCENPTYKKEGSEVVLMPDHTADSVKTILWKHGDNLAMEYYRSPDSTFAYRQFHERGSLNTDNGAMTITGLTRNDSGVYTVEINSQVNKKITLEVIASVVKPNISASCDGDRCNLTCEGDTVEANPVSYNWIFDKKLTQITSKEYTLTKDENVTDIQCELKNPVSDQQSDPYHNPLISTESPALSTGAIVGVVVGVILLICVILAVLHRKGIITIPFDRICPAQVTGRGANYVVAQQDDPNAFPPNGPDRVPIDDPNAIPLNVFQEVTVEPDPSADPNQRPNGTVAARGGDDDATIGLVEVKVEPDPSADPNQRPNGTVVEVSADVHPNTYEDTGPAHEDQTASGDDSGEAPATSDALKPTNEPDDGESEPDKKLQEDEEDNEG